MTHLPRWRGTNQLQSSYDISLPSLGRAGEQGLPRDPASMVVSGHKLVVNHLTGNTHSLQILHPLGENTDTLEAVFMDHYEEYAFLVGCGLSRNSCWLPWFQTSSDSLPQEFAINIFLGHTNPNSNVALMHALMGQCKYFACCPFQGRMGHCLENLWKSEISETTRRGRLKLRGLNPWTTTAEVLFQPPPPPTHTHTHTYTHTQAYTLCTPP